MVACHYLARLQQGGAAAYAAVKAADREGHQAQPADLTGEVQTPAAPAHGQTLAVGSQVVAHQEKKVASDQGENEQQAARSLY